MSLKCSALFLAACLSVRGAGPAGPDLVWSDEFNLPADSAPDANRWVFDLGATGWGNNELQTYTAARENSRIVADAAATDGRALAIRALRSNDGGYTSARLKTQGKFAVTYGRIEARLKLPRGRGIWPAFWLLGASLPATPWPRCGEIDVMEIVGHAPDRLHGTVHGPGYSGSAGIGGVVTAPGGTTWGDRYRVYAIDWAPGKIEWSVDGAVYFQLTPAQLSPGAPWVFDAPMFLLLNLAVGGHWPGSPDASTVFPQALLVDYVRVYARPR